MATTTPATTNATTTLLTSPWWQDKANVFYDNRYQLAPERRDYLVERVRVIALFFGSYRNRSTKHFVKYLNKLYTVIEITVLNYLSPFHLIVLCNFSTRQKKGFDLKSFLSHKMKMKEIQNFL
jgi:hypothetical protein